MKNSPYKHIYLFIFLLIPLFSNASTKQAEGELNPSMGVGLQGIAYWATNFPFINLMKQAEAGSFLVRHDAEGKPEPIFHDEMASRGFLDENGWPKKLPKHYYWHTNVTADAEYVPSQRGTYHLRYQGEGDIRAITNGETLSQRPGEIIFSIPKDTIYIAVLIEGTDPHKTGDYIRNLSLVHEDNLALYEAGQIFNPKWLDLIKDLRVIRYMDWQFTNGSNQEHWHQRTQPDFNSWGVTLNSEKHGGVPLEAMVELANQIGADPWFNIPFHANDDYIRRFAQYIAEHLDPELVAHFEYSNEVWNWIFQQTRSAEELGKALFPNTEESPMRQYYGYRSAEISHLIHQVFGENARQRVHMTLATQTDDNNYQLQMAIVGAEKYAQQQKLSIPELFRSVAVTWYFGIPGEHQNQVDNWIKEYGEAKARTMIFDQLSGKKKHLKVPAEIDHPGVSKVLHNIELQAQLAQKYGLQTISYEGGTHLMGYEKYNEPLADFFITTNNDPRMAEIYSAIYQGWRKIKGATLLNHFVDVGRHSKWGSWGALQHLEDDTARWDFIISTNQVPQQWEKRSAFAFDHGKTIFGTNKNERFDGTTEEDYLIGNDGDDILAGLDKNDGLHGGNGADKLLGGNGNDVLVGGRGSDELSGGNGQDRFVFTSLVDGELDTILDYEQGDILDFQHLALPADAHTNPTRYIMTKKIDGGLSIYIDIDGPKKPNKKQAIAHLKNTKGLDIKKLVKESLMRL